MLLFSYVSPLAIIVVALINIILNAFWYSPRVFGTMWANSLNKSTQELVPSVWQYTGSFITSLIMAWVLAVLVVSLGIVTIGQAALLGLILWLGFVATTHFGGVVWADKPLKVYFIDSAIVLLSLVIMAIILTLWH